MLCFAKLAAVAVAAAASVTSSHAAAGSRKRHQAARGSREVLWLARNFLLHLQILIVVGWGFQCPW